MKITLDIPDSTIVMTCQFVYDDPAVGLAVTQKTFDTKTLVEMWEGERDENA